MRHQRLLTGSKPPLPTRLRTGQGFLGLGAEIAIGVALLASFIGFRFGFPFLDGKTAGDVNTCITDVKAALGELKKEREESNDPGSKELGWDDQRVQIIERCKALLARIANDLKSNRPTGFTDKGHVLTNLIPDTLDGFTISNKCSLENPPVGTAGIDYKGKVRAHIPFGGSNATGALNMTGAVGGQSDNFKEFENFTWSGTFSIPGAASKSAGGQTSSVNITAATTVLDRNGNPLIPSSSGITCPGGSTIQPGTGACKITCSASKSFTWKDPPIPQINAFLVGPAVLDLTDGRPPGFILLVWNVKDAESVSIDQDIGTVDKKGMWLAFPPLQDTTYTLTATGVRPQDTKTKSQTVKIVRKCSETQTAGGDTPDTRIINLAKTSGTFKFDYETYSQKDQMIVTYEGKSLFNTGCVGTEGTKSTTLQYSGSSTQISVQVIPNCQGGSGTAWNYTVHCPQ